VQRFHYRIDTARAGTHEYVCETPSSDPATLFLRAAVCVSRSIHRDFPGDATACRRVLEIVSALEARCAATVRELTPPAGHDRSSLH